MANKAFRTAAASAAIAAATCTFRETAQQAGPAKDDHKKDHKEHKDHKDHKEHKDHHGHKDHHDHGHHGHEDLSSKFGSSAYRPIYGEIPNKITDSYIIRENHDEVNKIRQKNTALMFIGMPFVYFLNMFILNRIPNL